MLALKSTVKLHVCKKDLYGRTVAEIETKSGVNINKKMTESGYVVVYPFQNGCDDYKKIEKTAKDKKLGVWSDAKFELPWNYRTRMVTLFFIIKY